MNDLVEKLLKLKPIARVGITIGLCVLVAGGYYMLFHMDMQDQEASLKAQRQQLEDERTQYEKRKAEYLAYRNELVQLQEQQRELLRALPKKQEIPSFMQSINEQAELAGLEVVELRIDQEVPEELYVKIPVKMIVKGPYHAITKFFKSVAELRRIVNVENLAMTPERVATESENAPLKLKAAFIAATFRYNESSLAQGGGQ